MNHKADPSDGVGDTLSPVKRALIEIRELRARVAQLESAAHEPVAIIGAGARLPGAVNDLASLWSLLSEGRSGITGIPPDRWDIDAWFDEDADAPGRMFTRHGGFIEHVDGFDAAFFGIAPREAETMDPQQRLLLETTWHALEDAGIAPDTLAGSRTGVFVGLANNDHGRALLADREHVDAYVSTGNAASVAGGRLSYVLGAVGPNITVDTACSSSLVALHLAVQSLRRGECDLALVGGVNLMLTPEVHISFSRGRMLARDGLCKTFDAQADGYVRSEGCAVVVLRRAGDLRDGRARSRAGARHRHQPRRPQWRPDRAQRPGARSGDRGGVGRCAHRGRRRGLCRSARHRHAIGRPDRDARAGSRAGHRPQRRRAAAGGLDQDQHRPPRGRCRGGRPVEGDARARTRADPAALELSQPEPADRLGRLPARERAAPTHGVADHRRPAHRRAQFVRFLRHQCACDPGTGTERRHRAGAEAVGAPAPCRARAVGP